MSAYPPPEGGGWSPKATGWGQLFAEIEKAPPGRPDGRPPSPKTVSGDQLVSEALELLNSSKITAVFVLDAGIPAGIVHLHDLLRAGVA